MATNAPFRAKAQLLGEVETWIVGRQYHDFEVRADETVTLEREPENDLDQNAIRVENGRSQPVGYLPRKTSRWLAPLLDVERIRVESYVPTVPTYTLDRSRGRTYLKLSVSVTEKGQDLLQNRPLRNGGDALHEIVRQAYLLARDCQSAELLQEMADGLRPLGRKNLLPESHLLLALLPTMAQELRVADSVRIQADFRRLLDTLAIGEPLGNHGLTIFPLFWPESHFPDYCLLSQAIADGLAVVEEANESGSVPHLRLTSRCDRPILVPEGEILIGAKQNRVVNLTVLVAPHAQFALPVSCVEQGRWRYKSRAFEIAACCAPPSLRSKKTRSVQRSRELHDVLESDQMEVWSEVAKGLCDLGVASATSSLADGFTAVEDQIRACGGPFSLPETAAGAVVAHGEHIVGMDLFDSHETFATLWERLRRSYYFDVLRGRQKQGKPGSHLVREFLNRIASFGRRRVVAAGMGEELEISGEGIVGAALLYSGRIVHLAAFREGSQLGGSGG